MRCSWRSTDSRRTNNDRTPRSQSKAHVGRTTTGDQKPALGRRSHGHRKRTPDRGRPGAANFAQPMCGWTYYAPRPPVSTRNAGSAATGLPGFSQPCLGQQTVEEVREGCRCHLSSGLGIGSVTPQAHADKWPSRSAGAASSVSHPRLERRNSLRGPGQLHVRGLAPATDVQQQLHWVPGK